jgi:AcrR family transcriptional regulator
MTNKERILYAATRLLAQKGYKEASMADLAGFIGVAQGTIFYHFNNKETLFLSVLKHFQKKIEKAFLDYENTNKFSDGLDSLLQKIRFLFHIAGTMGDEFLLLHRHDAYEIAEESRECRRSLERIYSSLVSFLEQAIKIGQADGSIDPMQSRNTALTIFTLVDGFIRFNTYGIYETGVLYEDFIDSARRIVRNPEQPCIKDVK